MPGGPAAQDGTRADEGDDDREEDDGEGEKVLGDTGTDGNGVRDMRPPPAV
ncbi:hypothetical protein [Streptomyces sp. AC495_CC817]|uniref:hypothetical protein n=1 Tax=Streptomyces sp. AC495_CC817 TaxID=2823900 RepID=UPI001C26323E|nr:hypothetical protein [Streptomyces sp. AC495_CC817]